MTFTTGEQVRTKNTDPPHHTRLPRYARGALGTIVRPQGAHTLPDDVVRGITSQAEAVYEVRFSARELFGAGDHTVTLSLWESYLEKP
ncbi:hypothetical protein ALI144C_50690 [Actinosynnema sp. ALI-1.44]|uniref:SH3-like domain-containing protein n=1 Tax=Actinosynnema sp. ALI-1.44 TaxID=1933779 RepID=UPI00097BE8C3|nr:SH3-like domain-containing protein [Actinosynnema sp. ALI-1.44]ONI70865.1 hypothetical protein ALI144C_50690 [Actinosynnema sp. ALI-1.44]